MRLLLLTYLTATAAALWLFLLSVAWQAVAAAVHRRRAPASVAVPKGPRRGVVRAGAGEQPSVTRERAA